MRSRCDRLIWAVTLGVVLVVGPALPARAERLQSDFVFIRGEDVVSEDLYAAANRITIAGRVEGDLLAVAFEEILIEGTVTGSVTALASRVVVTGDVGGSLRVAAPVVRVEGAVGDDVFVAADRLDVTEQAVVGRDLLAWTRRAMVAGSVGRNLEGRDRDLTLRGDVAGDVEVTVNSLVVAGARVGGDLAYRAPDPAEVTDLELGGSLLHRRPLPPNIELRALRMLVFVLAWLGTVALGLAVLWAFPDRAGRAVEATAGAPGRALARGVAVAAVPVALVGVVAGLLAVVPTSSAVPLLVVFVPVILVSASLVGVGLLVASVPVAVVAGRRLRAAGSDYAAFLLGMAAWAVVYLLPFVGRWLTVAGLVVGLGAWMAPKPQPPPAESPPV